MATGPPRDEFRVPAGEQRIVTVLFCDLVDSSRLAGRTDGEDWREDWRRLRRLFGD